LRYLSFNTALAKEFASSKGLALLKQMKLKSIATDFSLKNYTSDHHFLSLAIFGIINRMSIA
jgi:hypothetical protein